MPIFGRGDYHLVNTDEDPIPEKEPVMLIRAQDTLGYLMVMIYALLAEILLFNPRLAARAREHARLFKQWPTKKDPDVPRDMPMT